MAKKTKRLTKAQRADDLLSAADYWQNGNGPRRPSTIDQAMRVWWRLDHDCKWLGGCADGPASCALSEVAWHLGYDLVNADDTPVEKVVRLAPRTDCGLVREDGTVQRLYRAVG